MIPSSQLQVVQSVDGGVVEALLVREGLVELDLAPSAPWRPIIALQQLQALRLQIRQRLVFGSIAALAGGGVCHSARGGGPFSKEFH